MATRSGFVALVGRPNAGKSTLLNRIIGQKVSIVSDKPQTTRRRILGVLTEGEDQIAFVDTPGIHRPEFRLNERMMETVRETMRDVDLIVHLVDASQPQGKGEQFAVEMMRRVDKPVLLALNKADLINKGRLLPLIETYNGFGVYEEIVPISALSGDNVDALLQQIRVRLPESEFLYDEEMWTDQIERSMIAEIIREKVLLNTRQELPYSTAVQVEGVDEDRRDQGFVRVIASIVVERSGQKSIIIGRGGTMIKKIGTAARLDIQRLLDVKSVYLELNVKVIEGWRNRDNLLVELGAS